MGPREGHGLGDRFLGHIERTSVLLHLIDCTLDDPLAAYNTIRTELREYGGDLDQKPEIIALTKMDVLGEELAADQAKMIEDAIGVKPYIFSSLSKEGMMPILYELSRIIKEAREDDSNDNSFETTPENDIDDYPYDDDYNSEYDPE